MPSTPSAHSRASGTASPIAGLVVLCLFGLIFGGFVAVFDGVIAYGLLRQHAAASYPTTTGSVTDSRVTTTRGSKGGTNYHAKVRYTYTVADRTYTSDRYSYAFGSSSQSVAHDIVRRHPVGATPLVHYNPQDPADAVLDSRFSGSALLPLIFMLPFNCATIGLWRHALAMGWRLITRPPVGGLRTTESDGFALIRVSWSQPFTAALIALGVAGFVSIFGILLIAGQNPSIGAVLTTLAIDLAFAVLVFLFSALVASRSSRFIAIDTQLATLTLPKSAGSPERTIPLADITAISSRTERRGKSATTYLTLQHPAARTDFPIPFAPDRLPGLITYLTRFLPASTHAPDERVL